MLAIYRDDFHGRLVVELPGKVFVMGTTPQEIVDRLTAMGATITAIANRSIIAREQVAKTGIRRINIWALLTAPADG